MLGRLELNLARYFGISGSYESAEMFSALYERTHLIVFRYIYALHGEPQEDAEDLWLETFAKAWKSRRRFSGSEDAALGWLLQIARNLVIDRHRRRQRQPQTPVYDLEQVAAADELPESQLMLDEQHKLLWSLLERLPDAQREMLILRYILGWRVNQIANYLKIPENTVSITLRRALTKLSNEQEVQDDSAN